MKSWEFAELMKATFRGVVVRPKLDGFRPNFYIPSINTIVFYDDREYEDKEILDMKYQIFNLTIDEWESPWLFDKKPSEFIKHIRIRKGREYEAIRDIMVNAEGKVLSYEGTLRLRARDIEDSKYDREIENRLIWR